MSHFDPSIPVETIFSGKLRRYHNLSLLRQLLRPVSIVLPNVRDLFLVIIGIIQSLSKLMISRPDVIFTKGGFVCLPVGVAAKILSIPLVIHDSDAHPGLTNRILAKWAQAIATGAPLKYYPYPRKKSKYVGIPIASEFEPLSVNQQLQIKKQLGFDASRPLVVVTGGGLGAQRINNAVSLSLSQLLNVTSVALISGAAQYDELRALTPENDERFQLHAFISQGMASWLGAADIVVARAGATTIMELAALGKPTVLIPNGYLSGGHQLKNAAAYAENGAVVIIDEHELDKRPEILVEVISSLLANPSTLSHMSQAIKTYAHPDAARDVASMILAAAK